MTDIFRLEEIRELFQGENCLAAIEKSFVLYSSGRAVVPPVGELLFDDPPGEVHIKYGYIRGESRYLVKIASGFYRNAAQGRPATPGLMILASQRTGEIEAILLEEGYLTNLRTAIAGAVAARYLAPHPLTQLAIYGTGTQARLQLEQLKWVTPCRKVAVWGRSAIALTAFRTYAESLGFEVATTQDVATASREADLIVTATPSEEPYLFAHMLKTSVHITAVGADTERKRELDVSILASAHLLVADSLAQCRLRGEIHHALEQGACTEDQVVELGELIAQPERGRKSSAGISVADLTGLAVQDIAIAELALDRLRVAR